MGIQTPYNNAVVNGIAMVYLEDCETEISGYSVVYPTKLLGCSPLRIRG